MKNRIRNENRGFAFRQWTRKPYAIFNSLKLISKISVMSAAYTLVNPVQEVKAQSDSIQTLQKVTLEDVEVSGQRTIEVYSQMSRVISVITRKEIEQAPAQNVVDLLKQVPQVDIRQRGVNGAQADISIQGGSFDQTLILLNGVNLTDPQTGHYNLTLPFELESVDRIEILKGPASRIFGINAFSGAVNFVTGQDTSNYIKSAQTAGDYGMYRGSITLNQHGRNFHNFVSVSKSQSNGYIHNTDYNFKNAYYHGKLALKQGDVAVQLGYTQKKFGANGFYSPAYPNQYDNTDTYFGSISAGNRGKIKVSPTIYWKRNYDHFILDYTNPGFSQNFHFTDVYGAGVNSSVQTSLGKTTIGIDYRKEIIYSTVLGTPSKTKKIPGQDSIRYNMHDWRENLSAYLEHNAYIGNFTASTGVMLNRNNKLSHLELYPGTDMSYKLTSSFTLFASLNRSLRLPSFTDLYYKGKQNRGNPDLKPEKAWSTEAGIKFNLNGINGSLSYFHRWGNDIIDWVKDKDSTVWHTVNFTTLNTDGLEFSTHLVPGELINPSSFIRDIYLSYSFTTMSKNSDTLQSNYALDYLRHKLTLGITHCIAKNMGATWNLNWQNRNGVFSQYDRVTKLSALTPYVAFMLVDGRIFYSLNHFRVFAEASNIFNVQYVDIGNLAQPGRWFRAGMEISLGWK